MATIRDCQVPVMAAGPAMGGEARAWLDEGRAEVSSIYNCLRMGTHAKCSPAVFIRERNAGSSVGVAAMRELESAITRFMALQNA